MIRYKIYILAMFVIWFLGNFPSLVAWTLRKGAVKLVYIALIGLAIFICGVKYFCVNDIPALLATAPLYAFTIQLICYKSFSALYGRKPDYNYLSRGRSDGDSAPDQMYPPIVFLLGLIPIIIYGASIRDAIK